MIVGILELADVVISHKNIIRALKNNEFKPRSTGEILINLAEAVKEQNAELEELRAEIACQTKKEGGQE
ncbi:MAG: hypothetical protein PHD60_11475 [Clostridia bacterium]|nr:hypothetical protein [Clostridia bacterium]